MTGILSKAYTVYATSRDTVAMNTASLAARVAPSKVSDRYVQQAASSIRLFPVNDQIEALPNKIIRDITRNVKAAQAVNDSLQVMIHQLGLKKMERAFSWGLSRSVDVAAVTGLIAAAPFAACAAMPSATMCAAGAAGVVSTTEAVAGGLGVVSATRTVAPAINWLIGAERQGPAEELRSRFIDTVLAAYRPSIVIAPNSLLHAVITDVVRNFLGTLYDHCKQNHAEDVLADLRDGALLQPVIDAVVIISNTHTHTRYQYLASLENVNNTAGARSPRAHPLALTQEEFSAQIGRIIGQLNIFIDTTPQPATLSDAQAKIARINTILAQLDSLRGDFFSYLNESQREEINANYDSINRIGLTAAETVLVHLHREAVPFLNDCENRIRDFDTMSPSEKKTFRHAVESKKQLWSSALEVYTKLNGRSTTLTANITDDIRRITAIWNVISPSAWSMLGKAAQKVASSAVTIASSATSRIAALVPGSTQGPQDPDGGSDAPTIPIDLTQRRPSDPIPIQLGVPFADGAGAPGAGEPPQVPIYSGVHVAGIPLSAPSHYMQPSSTDAAGATPSEDAPAAGPSRLQRLQQLLGQGTLSIAERLKALREFIALSRLYPSRAQPPIPTGPIISAPSLWAGDQPYHAAATAVLPPLGPVVQPGVFPMEEALPQGLPAGLSGSGAETVLTDLPSGLPSISSTEGPSEPSSDGVAALLPQTDAATVAPAGHGEPAVTIAMPSQAEMNAQHIQQEIQGIRNQLQEAEQLLAHLRGSDGWNGEVDRLWREYFQTWKNELCSMMQKCRTSGIALPEGINEGNIRDLHPKHHEGRAILKGVQKALQGCLSAETIGDELARIAAALALYQRADQERAALGGNEYNPYHNNLSPESALAQLRQQLREIEMQVGNV